MNRNILEESIEEAIIKLQPELSDLIFRFKSKKELSIDNGGINGFFAKNGLSDFFDKERINIKSILSHYNSYGKSLEKYVEDVEDLVKSRFKIGQHILVEGTQGALLDISYGSYPYVTAGLTTRPGLEHDAGIPIDLCFNVVKAYTTRVGKGPFPTEILDEELATRLREAGNEYGATTGRPRRVGWLDAVALRKSLSLNSRKNEIPFLVVTKLDILKGFEPKICDSYEIDGRISRSYESRNLEKSKPYHYIEFQKLEEMENIKKFDQIDENAQHYINEIERISGGAEVIFVGNGPKRENMIIKYT